MTSGKHHARLYQLKVDGEKLSLLGHTRAVPGVAFSPDGTQLASVSPDKTVRAWDAVTGRKVWDDVALPGRGQALAYSPDGELLAAADLQTHWVWVLDARTGKRLLELGTNEYGATHSVQFSPDGRCLATASSVHGIEVWAIERRALTNGGIGVIASVVKSTPGRFHSLVFAPDSQKMAFVDFGGRTCRVYVWQLDGAGPPRIVGTNLLMSHQAVSFGKDSRHLLVVNRNQDVVTIDAETESEISSFPTVDPEREGTGNGLLSLCLSPDGTKLAGTSIDHLAVDIWDRNTRRLLYSLPAQKGSVWWLAWSADSQRLAVSRANSDIAVWNLKEVEQVLAKLGLNP